MSAQADQAKAHAKDAAGLLTGDAELQAQGKAEGVAGEHQEEADHLKGKVAGAVDKVAGALDKALDKAKTALHH